jgi:hypothetical protein
MLSCFGSFKAVYSYYAGTRVKRKNPISEEAAKTFDARSVFATPFPWNISLEEVHDFFAGHAQVQSSL